MGVVAFTAWVGFVLALAGVAAAFAAGLATTFTAVLEVAGVGFATTALAVGWVATLAAGLAAGLAGALAGDLAGDLADAFATGLAVFEATEPVLDLDVDDNLDELG